MRPNLDHLEKHRVTTGHFASNPGDPFGAFLIPGRGGKLRVIFGDGNLTGWEHASACFLKPSGYRGKVRAVPPSWDQMAMVKDLFWKRDECCVQYHPPEEDYVNHCEGALHIWRPTNQQVPMPPIELV